MKVWFHPEVQRELLESVAYYAAHEPSLGRRFFDQISEAVQRIERHPDMYPRGIKRVRYIFRWGGVLSELERRLIPSSFSPSVFIDFVGAAGYTVLSSIGCIRRLLA